MDRRRNRVRRLTCQKCGDRITVHEIPVEHIDPRLYVCGQCVREVPQLQLEQREETLSYNPAISEIPI